MPAATLCYCIRGNEVLLGMKKVRFGAGKWNGFGGKVAQGETVRAAAVREMEEESGVRIVEEALEEIADIEFFFGEKPMFHGYVFRTHTWEGEPHESEEMRPQWFPLGALPWEDMWDSDKQWLSEALAGQHIKAMCRFDEQGEKVREFMRI